MLGVFVGISLGLRTGLVEGFWVGMIEEDATGLVLGLKEEDGPALGSLEDTALGSLVGPLLGFLVGTFKDAKNPVGTVTGVTPGVWDKTKPKCIIKVQKTTNTKLRATEKYN